MRSPTRRPSVRPGRPGRLGGPGVLAALAVVAGLLSAGCGGGDTGRSAADTRSADRTPLLQPAAAQGPNPFTGSTVLTADRAGRRSPSPAVTGTPAAAADAADQPLRTVDGATPGLYGGAHSLPSCDVEQQVRFLTSDAVKARVFAEAAGINQAGLGAWLRGLTPVMLRADTRVTGHGYRDGAAVSYQAVLEAGTAVLVDEYGAPRVRCACGNPLRTPADATRPTAYRGQPWDGYRADRVVLVNPTQRALDSLLIVNVLNDTWLEREVGTGGEQDREPAVPPAYEPGDRHIADHPVPDGGAWTEAEAGNPAANATPAFPRVPAVPPPPPVAVPGVPVPDEGLPDAPMPDGALSDGQVLEGPVVEPAVFEGQKRRFVSP
ncbi:DUF6777 domain-containing protein [Streptomyces sp. TRM49041]|uniref:DUF6777 domain-containing protein n=1 Tax=Streptomyces sp. TRM49041 TaxID=2603216 RepID=UPI0011EC4789|nr:DUF6777 domain-containing protein [Streptomyces sp. TRM49041]